MASNVLFKYGAFSAYQALEKKDANTLYFTTDTLQLFKGDKEYSKSAKLVASLPDTSQEQGVIYVRTSDYTAHIYDGSEFKQLTRGYAETIGDSVDNTTVPTTKAVKDYVESKIAEVNGETGVFVTDVKYANETGTLTVEKGEGDSTDTVLTGVAHNPTYEAETRTIKIPIFGGQELVIALGKDAVVESGSYNEEENTIDLVLTSGDPVKIPVDKLVDVYTGEATETATTTVTDDKKVKVEVKVSTTDNNALTKDENGLFVEKIDAYTKTEVDGKLAPMTEHIADKTKHISAEDKEKWDAAEQNAKDYADGLNTAMDTRVKALETAKTGIEGRVEAVETALTWATIA